MYRYNLFLFCFSFITLISSAQTQYFHEGFEFKENSTAFVFGDGVKLRKEPNVNSEVVDILNIGDMIKIISKSEKSQVFNGIQSNWYKIKKGDQVGYTLKGLISVQKITNNQKQNFYFSLKKKDNILYLLIRTKDAKTIKYSEITQELIGDTFELYLTLTSKLTNVINILEIDYLAENTGAEGGSTYMFWNGSALKHVADVTSTTDDQGYVFSQELMFPDKTNGLVDKIKFKQEVSILKDKKTNWKKTSLMTRELSWDGIELTPDVNTKWEEKE